MKKLFCAVMCLGCVTDSFAMNSVKRFCDCIGEKVAAFVPQSRFGKAAGGVVVLVTGYSVYKLVELTERVNKLSRMLDRSLMMQFNATNQETVQFVRPITGQMANENVADENTTNENAVDEDVIDENTTSENAVDEDVIDESTANESAVDEDVIDENTTNENAVNEDVIDENTTNENAVNENVIGENTTNENAVNGNVIDENTTNENAVNENVIDENTTNENAVNGDYKTQMQSLGVAIDTLRDMLGRLQHRFMELSRSIDNNSAFDNFSNSNNNSDEDFTPVKGSSQPASPIVHKDDVLGGNSSSLDLSFGLNSSLSVSSFIVPEGKETINLKFDGFTYKGQGHGQEPLGKGEVISAASSSFRIEGFFSDGQLMASYEYPICFKNGGTRFTFKTSEKCQPIAFEFNDFKQIRLVYAKSQTNYLLLLTNKANDNFIFRPAYFYKGQVSSASHLPEGDGVMIKTDDGSILKGEFKGERLKKPISEAVSEERKPSVLKEKKEKDTKTQEDQVELKNKPALEDLQPEEEIIIEEKEKDTKTQENQAELENGSSLEEHQPKEEEDED